jgi:hypothetical protein
MRSRTLPHAPYPLLPPATVQWSPTRVTCVTPRARGTNLPVSLLLPTLLPSVADGAATDPSVCATAGTFPTGRTFTFVDAAPVITEVHPRTGPTTGGTTVTLSGSGLGSVSPPRVFLVVVLAGGRAVDLLLPVTAWGPTFVRASMAPGVGANLTLAAVHGDTGARAEASAVWSFPPGAVAGVRVVDPPTAAPPARRLVASPCVSSGSGSAGISDSSSDSSSGSSSGVGGGSGSGSNTSCTRVAVPVTGSVTMELFGAGFGPDAALAGAGGGVHVALGGAPCRPLDGSVGSVFVNDGLLRCVVQWQGPPPAGPLSLRVTVAGQAAALPPAGALQLQAVCGVGFTDSLGALAWEVLASQ